MTKKLFMLMLLFSANVFAAPVNINKADAQKIADSLKMIGEKKAQSIIEYHVKNGQPTRLKATGKQAQKTSGASYIG